jgi:hypothetical protein
MQARLCQSPRTIRKDDPRDYRGANIKRTMVTAIECISADGRSFVAGRVVRHVALALARSRT